MPIPAVIIGGAKIAASMLPMLMAGRGGKSTSVNYPAILNKYMRYQPSGWFNPEDQGFVDRQVGSATRQIGATAGDARQMAARRYASRGLGGSPGLDSAQRRINQVQLGSNLDAAEGGMNMAYDMRQQRAGYQQGLVRQGMAGELEGAVGNLTRGREQQAAFWNGMNKYVPQLLDYFGGKKNGNMGPGTPAPQKPPA